MESIRIVANTFGRKMLCPECDRILPIDHTTECKCGVHLEVNVETIAPVIKEVNDD